MRWLEHHTIHWLKWWFKWSLCYENLIGVWFSLDSSMKFLIEISWISNGNWTHPSDFHSIKIIPLQSVITNFGGAYGYLLFFDVFLCLFICLIFYKIFNFNNLFIFWSLLLISYMYMRKVYIKKNFLLNSKNMV